MKKPSRRHAMLLVGAIACAFATPPEASAASWGVVGTEHTLDSPDFGFSTTVPIFGAITSTCLSSTLTSDVASASVLTVTSASFRNCTASGPNIGVCTTTTTATSSPNPDWRVTAPTTSNIQIHGVVIDIAFRDNRATVCNVEGLTTTLTGTLGGGQWNGNGANQHEVIYNDDGGFVMHTPAGTAPVTTRATLRDTQQTLTLN
jgi:hypothetical protein